MTVRLTFQLPSDVTQCALRFPAVPVNQLPVDGGQLASWAELQDDQRVAAAQAAHEGDLQPCPHCQLIGHNIRFRGYPVLDPGPCPPGDVLDDVAEGCHCCFWGGGPTHGEPLYARLSREAHQGRDVQVEHLDRRTARWTKFETRFEAA